ncbi:MAG: nitrile hydratase accessory protein [Pseudomonadota bacterium]
MREPDRPFDAPWQAQLFGLTVALNETGAFAWRDWAARFGAQLEGVSETGNEAYYRAWLRAFEGFLVETGAATAAEVADLTAAWHAAAHATPHGQPIVLASACGSV